MSCLDVFSLQQGFFLAQLNLNTLTNIKHGIPEKNVWGFGAKTKKENSPVVRVVGYFSHLTHQLEK